jgi:FtsP/CotA-like multicopper oxidase with cupredoxin domain
MRKATFLIAGTLAAAGVVLPTLGQHGHSHTPQQRRTPAQLAEAIGCDPSKVYGNDLVQPKIIRTQNGRIDTTMVIDQVTHACIPVWDKVNGWVWDPNASLKTYGTPKVTSPQDWNNLEWTLPGPTFLMRKTYLKDVLQPPGPTNPVIEQGSRVAILLRNQLPNDPYPYDECRPKTVTSTKVTQTCQNPPCTFEQVAPECFHGNSVTNLHFHGTHVSPQPHQDFVLLNLFSAFQTDPPPPPADTFNQVGNYQFDLDPFPWNQAPGTHWYHPHKHGSTAHQVANGMSGTLMILGEFDDWLYGQYGVDPTMDASLQAFDKVMIVQQLQEDLNFFTPGAGAPKPVINGQASPVIHMKPGEIQRWRIVGGTTEAGGVFNITLPGIQVIKQIAQDGVQFASENFDRQPYLTGTSFAIAPGSRMDFLVQAPTTSGTLTATYELKSKGLPIEVTDILDDVKGTLELELDAAKAAAENQGKGKGKGKGQQTLAAAAPTLPPLFTVSVDKVPAVKMEMPLSRSNPACQGANPPKNCWPAMPYFLQDLEPSKKPVRKVQFSMRDPNTNICTKNAQQGNSFWIDNTQYDGSCAPIQMELDTVEDWQIFNDSPLGHPFHIHINPFQVLVDDGNPQIAKNGPPWVWRDSIPLPVGTALANGCNTNQSVQIRHEFSDYTGAYVIHCHFLGHEDRGMMLNVETICPQGQFFGRPMAGLPDNCAITSPADPPACKKK